MSGSILHLAYPPPACGPHTKSVVQTQDCSCTPAARFLLIQHRHRCEVEVFFSSVMSGIELQRNGYSIPHTGGTTLYRKLAWKTKAVTQVHSIRPALCKKRERTLTFVCFFV